MKTYLVDTHILLWWLFNDKSLNNKIKDLIVDPNNQIFVSSVSIWEIVIKQSLNKLKAPDNLKEQLELNNINILDMTMDHILYLKNLPNIHNDPFDRILISQCIVEDLIMVTSDKVISKYDLKCF